MTKKTLTKTVKVMEASEPSNIIWENQCSINKYYVGKYLANITVLIAIAIYYKGMLTTKRKAYHLNEFYPKSDCYEMEKRYSKDPVIFRDQAAFYYMEPKIYKNSTGYTPIQGSGVQVCFCESYEHNQAYWSKFEWGNIDNITFKYEGE